MRFYPQLVQITLYITGQLVYKISRNVLLLSLVPTLQPIGRQLYNYNINFNFQTMSDHLEMSGQSSMDKNFQIRTNNEGENQLYIPCWEEEGSNSTQYHHLIEQTKFFKNKCKHLENHLEENHREFSSLNQLYLLAETNERRLLKQNQDLRKVNRELISELSQAKITIDTTATQLHAGAKRQSEYRQKIFKNKQRQTELIGEIQALRSEIEMLKRKNAQQGSFSGAEEEKWKRYYNQQVAKNEQQWKAAYEELEMEFDKKSREVREKNQEIKSILKECKNHKEDYEIKIKGLQGDLLELRGQLSRAKTSINDYERQIKDLKLVRDEVSAKNDQIQGQNSKLKKALKQEGSKYHKLDADYRQLQFNHSQIINKYTSLTSEANDYKNQLAELRLRLANQQKQLNLTRSQRDKAITSKNHIENIQANLQQEYAAYRRQKENDFNNLKAFYEGKLKEMRQKNSNEISILQTSIYTQKQQIQSLKSQRRDNLRLEASMDRITQLQQQNATLKDEVLNWRGKFQRLNAKYREQQLSIPKECHHEDQINGLKQQILTWRGKFDKLNTKYQEQQSLPKECHHEDEIIELRQNFRRAIEQKEEYKINSVKSGKLIEDLNAQMEEYRQNIQRLTRQNQKLGREKKKLTDEKEILVNDKNTLTLLVEHLQNERNQLINQKKQLISQQKSNKTQTESESSQRIKLLQQKLKEKSIQISKITNTMELMKQQLQSYRSRPREDVKDNEKTQKDKNKKYEQKIKEKEKQIRELQEKIEQIQNDQEEQRAKYKSIQKENKNKENQLNKKEKRLKQLEKNVEELLSQVEQLERQKQNYRIAQEALKKQLKSQQNLNQKLKIQIQRHSSQKQNFESQETNTNNTHHEKQRHSWEQRQKQLSNDIRAKDEEIASLKKQITSLKESIRSNEHSKPQTSNINPQLQQYLRTKIQQLQYQLREKEQIIKRLQNIQRKDDDIPSGNLQQLQAEYNRQLLALKRLIMYKGYKQDENRKLDDLKAQYQNKIQIIMADYKSMYQQMMILKERVLNQRVIIAPPEPTVDIGAVEEVWRIKVQQISEERQLLIEKVAMWQRKYEELRFLFEAKLQSKEETINLLNLKLSNLEISRPMCQYSCHHR